MTTFELEPTGGYSLKESAGFIDAWHEAPSEGGKTEGQLHLAFLTDREWTPAGVCLTDDRAGAVRATVYGDAPADAVRSQTARILSLDVDGRAWPEVARRDPVVDRLQRSSPDSDRSTGPTLTRRRRGVSSRRASRCGRVRASRSE